MDITFRNHPAQARHPVTNATFEDDGGEPVPLFPRMRAIYLDGVMCGYCDIDGGPVALTVHVPIERLSAIAARVTEEFGKKPLNVSMPPLMPENPIDLENPEE